MADEDRPEGYVPFLELWLRKKHEGGDVLSPGELRGAADARVRSASLMLVHGFNNDEIEAAKAYLGFRTRQTTLTGAQPFTFDRYFGDTFWPGDADWSIVDFADFLVYPKSVKRAVRAGRELASLLWTMPNLHRVSFIAHSLGCRVVMEALAALEERALPVVEKVCFMAAAVPSEMFEPKGRFYKLMERLQARGTEIFVLHSVHDRVLTAAFPPGQTLAGEPSVRALGRVGPSAAMPGYLANLNGQQINGADHGHYWGHNPSGATQLATQRAGEFLGLGDVVRGVGVSRQLGSVMPPIDARELGATRLAFD